MLAADLWRRFNWLLQARNSQSVRVVPAGFLPLFNPNRLALGFPNLFAAPKDFLRTFDLAGSVPNC